MMKKDRLIIFLVCLLSGFAAHAQDDIQEFVVKVGDFTSLSVIDNINVEYKCNPDSTGLAVFSADSAMANQMIFTNNKKGKLTISVGTDSVYINHLPVITVYSSYLQEAENSGDSTLIVRNVAPAPQVKFKLQANGSIEIENVIATKIGLEIFTGNGLIKATGKCTELSIKNTGTGTVDAKALQSKNVNCRLLGTGKVYCYVDEGKLSIKGSGTGKVYYVGKPSEIKSFQLGTIKAIDNNDAETANPEEDKTESSEKVQSDSVASDDEETEVRL